MSFNTAIMRAIDAHAANKTLLNDGNAASLDTASVCAEVRRVSVFMRELGSYGLAIAMDNSPAWVIADLAALESGIWTLPLPPFFSETQRRNAIERSGCPYLLSDQPQHRDTALHTLDIAGKAVFVLPVGSTKSRDLTHAGTAKITFTSGSTSAPKGICLSQQHLFGTALSVCQCSAELGIDTHVSLLPLAVLLENVAGVYAALFAGVCCVIPPLASSGVCTQPAPDAEQLHRCLAQYSAQSCILVPELLKGLCREIEAGAGPLAQMCFVAVGGAPVGAELLRRAQACKLPVFEGYGLSEAGSVTTLNRPALNRAGSVGAALQLDSLCINERGELLLAEASFLGYCGDDKPLEKPFPTGDIGAIDSDGFVYIHGRKKNTLITSMGRNVSPEWVESELTGQPAITQALVYCDDRAQLSAWLVSACDDLSIEHTLKQVNKQLPDYAQVQSWSRVPCFQAADGTLTGNGKLRRDAIVERQQRVCSYTETSV